MSFFVDAKERGQAVPLLVGVYEAIARGFLAWEANDERAA